MNLDGIDFCSKLINKTNTINKSKTYKNEKAKH